MKYHPASKRLLRLISARCDMASAIEAYGHFMTCPSAPAGEFFFFSMLIAYGRPFTESYKLGRIQTEYPNYPDFSDSELNLRHQRMIDLRNKFLAHSSAEGLRVMVVPPGILNPVTSETSKGFDHNVGKRVFLDPRYAEWLIDVAVAFKGRLDQDVQNQLGVEFASLSSSEIFELETAWNDFKWT